MNFFEKEMRQMFDSTRVFREPVFIGKTLLAKLDKDLRVKLQFSNSRSSNQYDGITVTIINRTGGVVDTQMIVFSDIIGKYKTANSLRPTEHHIWEASSPDSEPRWYTPITQEQKAKIADVILSYIATFHSAVEGSERPLPRGMRAMNV